jgi:hypothetical protein
MVKTVSKNNNQQDTRLLDDLAKDMEELTRGVQRLEELMEQMTAKQSTIDQLIQTTNARQIENFANQLGNVLDKEMKRRKFLQSLENDTEGVVTTDDDDEEDQQQDLSKIVTMDMFHEYLDTNVVLQESEVQMKNFIMQLVKEELDTYKNDVMATSTVEVRNDDGQDSRSEGSRVVDTSKDCPTTIDIVQKVQQALNVYANDGIGLVDHARGAQVVHWMTSSTYSPPPKATGTLGSVWWRNYFLAEDWENLLPDGWENWNVGIPSYLYNSLVSQKVVMENYFSVSNTIHPTVDST